MDKFKLHQGLGPEVNDFVFMSLERRNYDPALMAGAVQSVVSADIDDGVIVNADISASAAIAYSKLALTGGILNADLSNSAGVTRQKLSAPAYRKSLTVVSATVATTGNTDCYVIAPEAGTLDSIDFSGVDALAAHDSNYITFSITNLGQAGAGNTAMLAATDANTTKATGGTAIVANGKRSLTVHGTGANLVVASGDRLLIRAAATGTLANTVTFPAYLLRFGGTT